MNYCSRVVFIMGCPRSGTTMSLDLLGSHPAFAWISHRAEGAPPRQGWLAVPRVYDLPGVGSMLYNRWRQYLGAPAEPWEALTWLLPGFRPEKHRQLTPADPNPAALIPEDIERARAFVDRVCRLQKKHIFLSKYTDFPRFRFLQTVFPEAVFVQIKRCPEAVINSHVQKVKQDIFRMWDHRDWWAEGWPETWRSAFYNRFHTPLGFCSFYYRAMSDLIELEGRQLPQDRILQVTYQAITNCPLEFTRQVLSLAKSPYPPEEKRHLNFIGQSSFQNQDWKWRQQLSVQEQTVVAEILSI